MLEYILVALAGLVVGSYITLASWRLPRDEDTVIKRSRCTACGIALGVRDLFPVVSWLMSGGKCKHCKARVHWRYPVIELICAALFLFAVCRFGFTLEALVIAMLGAGLLLMIVVDFEHYLIPDEVHLVLLPLGFAWRWLNDDAWMDVLGSVGLGAGLGMALHYGYLWLRKKEGLGFGDVKFFAVIGAWLPLLAWPPFLFYSGLLGVLTALLWRALGRGAIFPFGPALAAALYFCVVFPSAVSGFWQFPLEWLQ